MNRYKVGTQLIPISSLNVSELTLSEISDKLILDWLKMSGLSIVNVKRKNDTYIDSILLGTIEYDVLFKSKEFNLMKKEDIIEIIEE